MEKGPKIIAIIPARGGSKGIPRKNIRLLLGKPLISWTIEKAKKSKYIDEIFVSTDDEEIAEVSKMYGAEVIPRPKKLAGDEITLDPVIYHALISVEESLKKKYDFIITLQPTSPLVSLRTLDHAIKVMLTNKYDTLISVSDETHLYWIKKENKLVPLSKNRKNRQSLNKIYKETGAILISRREVISEKSRIGKKIFLFKMPDDENVDIDNYRDWWITENLLKKLNIVFRVDGYQEIGLGHVYRAITLANKLVFYHNISFLMNSHKKLGIEKVKEYNYPIITFDDEKEIFEKMEKISPHIVINDILDTKREYIKELKNRGYFVVNFEDLGEGSEIADIVMNALYENSYPPKNHYYGYKYVCLKEEFYIFPPKKVNRNVKKILITFGGTDPNNLTLKTIKAIEELDIRDINISVILGLGYGEKNKLTKYIDKLISKGFKINIKENVRMMAKEIRDADIVITSNGRTIYEVTSIGTPCISIAQNEREARHLFVHNSKCIKYLGMGDTISENNIASAMKELIKNFELRKEMNKKLLKYDLKKGIDRISRVIFDEYYDWRKNESKTKK